MTHVGLKGFERMIYFFYFQNPTVTVTSFNNLMAQIGMLIWSTVVWFSLNYSDYCVKLQLPLRATLDYIFVDPNLER